MESTTATINFKDKSKIRTLKIKKPLRNEIGITNDSSNKINDAIKNK
jgi:hypothetical protein